MNDMSSFGVNAVPGHEDDARKIMVELGYPTDRDQTYWLVPARVGYVQAKEEFAERLNLTDWDWRESLTIAQLPDHPDEV